MTFWKTRGVNRDKSFGLGVLWDGCITLVRSKLRHPECFGEKMLQQFMNSEIDLISSTPDDTEFLLRVYRESREDELAEIGWNDAQIEAFLSMQFSVREMAYKQQFCDAEDLIITFRGKRSGRLIVMRSDIGVRIVDIAICKSDRRKRLASSVIESLKAEAGSKATPLLLHVERANRVAADMYLLRGFEIVSENETHFEMQWLNKGR